MGVLFISRKSAISKPLFFCSSVAHCSSFSLMTTLEQMEESSLILPFHVSVAPKSGHNMTVRFFRILTDSSLKHPCIPPVANHTKSGIKWVAIKADFSLSTMATDLLGYAHKRCSPKKTLLKVILLIMQIGVYPSDITSWFLDSMTGFGII